MENNNLFSSKCLNTWDDPPQSPLDEISKHLHFPYIFITSQQGKIAKIKEYVKLTELIHK